MNLLVVMFLGIYLQKKGTYICTRNKTPSKSRPNTAHPTPPPAPQVTYEEQVAFNVPLVFKSGKIPYSNNLNASHS